MTAAHRVTGAPPPLTVLRGSPECRERAGGGLRGLDRRGVTGARYADPVRAEPPGHALLDGRAPCVVVLPVDDQDGRPAEVRELCRAIRAGQQVLAHGHEPGGAVAHHPLVQERDQVLGNPVRPGLGGQVLVPDPGDRGPQPLIRRKAVAGCVAAVLAARGVHHRQHAAQHVGTLAGEATGPGAEQGERGDPGRPRQRHLARDEPAQGVPDQVQALAVAGEDADDRGDVGGQLTGRVAARARGALALVLPAHVHGDHPAAGRRERRQHRDEIFLAAGEAGNEQCWPALAHARGRLRLKSRERAPVTLNGHPPDLIGQVS